MQLRKSLKHGKRSKRSLRYPNAAYGLGHDVLPLRLRKKRLAGIYQSTADLEYADSNEEAPACATLMPGGATALKEFGKCRGRSA